eukprot:TRINITY_DN46763_c0_g1_i1.p1 TRINITY_DN46763_c0_g1~~TRINITY_DN46763_c0_g1_i1.p1  ORF type:complete len:403 (+),score=88.97 TRINITY_DN46763_c0_g1_i1:84-1211(+)
MGELRASNTSLGRSAEQLPHAGTDQLYDDDFCPWVPDEGEHGLFEALWRLRSDELPLMARPARELQCNFFDYDGRPVDLSLPRIVAGAAQARKVPPTSDTGYVSTRDLFEHIIPKTQDEFAIVTHYDYSHWARLRYPDLVQGGFLSRDAESADSWFPWVLNPFRRGWVAKPLAIRLGEKPASFCGELTQTQWIHARSYCHENAMRRHTAVLSQDQMATIRALGRQALDCPDHDEDPIRDGLRWRTEGPWPLSQRLTAVCATAALALATLRGAVDDDGQRSRGLGFLWTLGALFTGAAAAVTAATAAGRELHRVPVAAPCAAIASAAAAVALLEVPRRARSVALVVHEAALFCCSFLFYAPMPQYYVEEEATAYEG